MFVNLDPEQPNFSTPCCCTIIDHRMNQVGSHIKHN
jgi:hypothetical protein